LESPVSAAKSIKFLRTFGFCDHVPEIFDHTQAEKACKIGIRRLIIDTGYDSLSYVATSALAKTLAEHLSNSRFVRTRKRADRAWCSSSFDGSPGSRLIGAEFSGLPSLFRGSKKSGTGILVASCF